MTALTFLVKACEKNCNKQALSARVMQKTLLVILSARMVAGAFMNMAAVCAVVVGSLALLTLAGSSAAGPPLTLVFILSMTAFAVALFAWLLKPILRHQYGKAFLLLVAAAGIALGSMIKEWGGIAFVLIFVLLGTPAFVVSSLLARRIFPASSLALHHVAASGLLYLLIVVALVWMNNEGLFGLREGLDGSDRALPFAVVFVAIMGIVIDLLAPRAARLGPAPLRISEWGRRSLI